MLVEHFLERFNRQFGRSVRGVDGEAMELFQQYRWPGNVRELRNVVERLVLLGPDDLVTAGDLPAEIRFAARPAAATTGACPFELPEEGVDLEAVEKGLLQQALTRSGGNQSAAARLLGISRYALRYRMEKFDLR
jgi:transcriptional regulator with PAS, ATPase and Fis domain